MCYIIKLWLALDYVVTSLVSRSIFFGLTDLDRPRVQPTRPRTTFDLEIDLD